jgi:hypothetical protein
MENFDDYRKKVFEMIKRDYEESWDEDLNPYRRLSYGIF